MDVGVRESGGARMSPRPGSDSRRGLLGTRISLLGQAAEGRAAQRSPVSAQKVHEQISATRGTSSRLSSFPPLFCLNTSTNPKMFAFIGN